MLLHVGFIYATLITSTTSGWVNDWDQPLSFQCSSRQYISWLNSKHSNYREDRIWAYGCTYGPWINPSSCAWSGYINNFDQEYFSYECGGNQVVTGFKSYHSNWREDRRWEVRCEGYDCAWTGYANQYDRNLYYFVPEGMAITGVASMYNNRHEDGKWSFRVCRFEKNKACNGLKCICGMPFNKVSFPGTHNSGSYGRINTCFTRNQDMNIHQQAVQGAKFFSLDTKQTWTGRLFAVHSIAYGDELTVILNDIARFLNSPINSHEVFVIRMSDTHNTNVDRLVWWYLRRAFPGSGEQTGINDHYSRTGRWPTIQGAIQQNKRVFIFAQDKLCNAYCRTKYRFFLRENSLMGDTYRSLRVSFSSDGIPGDTQEECAKHRSKTFVLMSHFRSFGLCLWHISEKCNPYVLAAYNACLEKRSVVNFIAVDFFEKHARMVVETALSGNREEAMKHTVLGRGIFVSNINRFKHFPEIVPFFSI